jgi:uncharacterized membrane protein YeaQ/YmgE (transglycosylase-associated protein family)
MDVVTLLTMAVLVGWLATLILQAEIDDVCIFDFSIAVTGAALTGGLLCPSLGIALTGECGLTLWGTLVSWAGATTLLGVVNLARYGRLRRGGRVQLKRAPMQSLTFPRND